MCGLMILFPEFPVSPLKNLQSLLFDLTSGQILHYSIVDVLSVETVRW